MMPQFSVASSRVAYKKNSKASYIEDARTLYWSCMWVNSVRAGTADHRRQQCGTNQTSVATYDSSMHPFIQ